MEDLLRQTGWEPKEMNARQAFQAIKGGCEAGEIAKPNPCEMQAPEQINVFSDGSLTCSRSPCWGLLGAGVWWPGRNLQDTPLSKMEWDAAKEEQTGEGAKLHSALGGFGGSSTRIEIVAGILACAADQAVHVGSDSQAFVQKANATIKMIKEGREPKKSWKVQVDGDLWEMFVQTVKAKGHQAIRVSWVKGHATKEMVNKGKVLARDKEGNDMADLVADQGVAMFGKDVKRMADEYAGRGRRMEDLTRNIHTYILEAVLIRDQILEQKAKEERDKGLLALIGPKKQITEEKLVSYTEEAVDEDGETTTFRNMLNVQNFDVGTEAAFQMQKFLTQLKVKKCQGEARGTTWLELYTLYKIGGNPCPVKDPIRKAQGRPVVRTQIAVFKAAIRAIAKHTMTEEQEALIRPAKFKGHPLKRLGIDMYLPMIGSRVIMEEKVAKVMDAEILRLKGLKGKDVKEVLAKTKQLRCGKVSFKNKAAWSRSIKRIGGEERRKEEGEEKEEKIKRKFEQQRKEDEAKYEGVNFQCQTCSGQTAAWRKGFDLRNLGGKTPCKWCHKGVAAKDWRCSCGHQWYQCHLHTDAPVQMRKDREECRRRRKEGEAEEEKKQKSKPSQHCLESRLAEQDDRAMLQKRVMRQEISREHITSSSAATLQRLARKVCSKTSLKRKFGHLDDTGGEASDL